MDDRQRYFIQLSYDGSNYHGWQRQPNDLSIQEVIEERLKKLYKHDLHIVGCGRTDTGVHARDFYAHADLEKDKFDNEDLTFKLNCMLPKDIAIERIFEVKNEAHARFDARSRTYEYFIHLKKNPFKRNHCWIYPIERLDMGKMEEYFHLIKNYRDFKSLSKFNPDFKTTICEIMDTNMRVIDDHTYIFQITANRFLRSMVRRIIGTMVLVGKGKLSLDEFQQVMEEKGEFKINIAAPPEGLFLTKIKYPYIEN